jgi:hypothetical protein
MIRYVTNTAYSLVIFLWTPAAAFAAALAATGGNESPLNVPLGLALATLLFSTLMGATTLAIRLIGELRAEPPKPLVAPLLYCLAHMLGSWSAGALFFVIAMSQGAGVWTLLGMVMAASFAGSKACEAGAEFLLPKSLPKATT